MKIKMKNGEFLELFNGLTAVQQLKGFVLKKMNQAMAIGSFQQTDKGLEVTDPEGFVAVDKSGGAVKLVDRLGFSRRNLTAVSKFKK